MEGFLDRLMVAPGVLRGSEAHGLLMPLTGHEHQIASFSHIHGKLNGLAPVADAPVVDALSTALEQSP